MRLNKRGVALLQVLIISAVLAGLSAMILRAVLSRTVTARKTYRTVTAQMIIESCMAEVNQVMSTQNAVEFAENIDPRFKISPTTGDYVEPLVLEGTCRFPDKTTEHTCAVQHPFGDSTTYTVKAQIALSKLVKVYGVVLPDESNWRLPRCAITYTIEGGVNNL